MQKTIHVTQPIIDAFTRGESRYMNITGCPLALAFKEAGLTQVAVGGHDVNFLHPQTGREANWLFTQDVREYTDHFVQNSSRPENCGAEPFTFVMEFD